MNWIHWSQRPILPGSEFGRLRPHLELEGTAAHDVGIHDVGAGIVLAVQTGALDVDVLVADVLGLDAECLAATDLHRDLGEERCAEDVLSAGRLHLIESHGREDVPSRHLSDILVAAETVGGIVVEFAHGLPD